MKCLKESSEGISTSTSGRGGFCLSCAATGVLEIVKLNYLAH